MTAIIFIIFLKTASLGSRNNRRVSRDLSLPGRCSGLTRSCPRGAVHPSHSPAAMATAPRHSGAASAATPLRRHAASALPWRCTRPPGGQAAHRAGGEDCGQGRHGAGPSRSRTINQSARFCRPARVLLTASVTRAARPGDALAKSFQIQFKIKKRTL